MKGNGYLSRRSARRASLMAATAAGLGAVVLVLAPGVAPNPDLFGAPARAQNLSEKAQQIPQKPVGFADIVEKVKPAVISVRVKVEEKGGTHLGDDEEEQGQGEIPLPPGSPFERFFRRFGMPDLHSGPQSSPARARASLLRATAMR